MVIAIYTSPMCRKTRVAGDLFSLLLQYYYAHLSPGFVAVVSKTFYTLSKEL